MLPSEDDPFPLFHSVTIQSSPEESNAARGGGPIELPGIDLEGMTEIYTGEELVITGNISLSNGSHITFKNCEVSMEAGDQDGCSIEIDGTSSFVMENSTLDRNGTTEGYNVTCLGMLSLRRSRMEGFDRLLISNATASVDSSNITIGEGTFRLNNSHLTLLNSTIDQDMIVIEGSSILYFQEYLHLTVTSWYIGPVELATVSIENGAGVLISTDMTDENGNIPVVTIETARQYIHETVLNGPHSINVSHSKFYGNKTVENITSERAIKIDLEPILGQITGRVSLPDGSAVPDATVSNEVVETSTSGDGKFTLSVFSGTTCTVTARKEHYSKEYYPGAYVGKGMTLVINFTLREDESPLIVKFLESSIYKIPINRTLTVEFPVALDPDTVNITTVLLFRTDGDSSFAVNRAISLGEDMRSIRITPVEDLEGYSWYTMILKREIRAHDHMEVIWRDFSYSFKTDYEPLKTMVPVDGARGVTISEPITIELNVPIKEETLNASTVFVMDSSGNPVNRELSLIGGNTIVLKRKANLEYDSTYAVFITPLLRDSDGQSVFRDGYSFGFRTAAQVFLPVIHINVTGEGGTPLKPLAAPRLNITRQGFFLDISADVPVVRRDLPGGIYNITAYANGYENITVSLLFENGKTYNQSFELKEVKEMVVEGRTSVGTIIVIGVIMGMFLLSILFLGVRRADRLVKGRTKKNIQRTGAPGMESFEYKLAPGLNVSELPGCDDADGNKGQKGDNSPKGSC